MNPTSPSFTPLSLPKRKRSSPSPPLRLTTDLPTHVSSVEDDEAVTESPRTKVASRFEGLHLDVGGVAKLNFAQPTPIPALITQDVDDARKRKKTAVKDHESEIPETPQKDTVISNSVAWAEKRKSVVFKGLPVHRHPAPKLANSNHSINCLAKSKSPCRKRLTTPPLFGKEGVAGIEVEAAMVEPIRSALTWRDDEITGHIPDDPDDDGEGINGVGFRPTAAQAEARAQRRRRQLEDYRSRESKEARAKRSERRRGSPGSARSIASAEAENVRKVRFSDAETATT